ncbi:SDR family NAD(P)-dependent oxidoreductase [Mycobacterium sp. CVI_P3]|uniref:SDR family NAD(P)-dependent oxidoreductase n=1 Tax=Mycobacterium pinniadriaticum TaxID=2994102 RepID=A0ABT3SI47_9MYCO|nr:SDR family NAD(P)-dependent oxidoreductase [Mycobacterium pinniadriaticum]MCX2932739.1 SDR family NAD(P)-dependent oxidoreductase [Mycobacterium pinniadriaticum]MCX2939201.1 SDR family NAD(P)-dependent oxidoreductase [Mycobacterium pinniadriaticum]
MAKTNLTSRVVAVTGGARGIGAAIAAAFIEAGAKVAIGDIDVHLAEKTAGALGCWSAGLDVADRAGFAEFLDSAAAALGPVDVLINNAGIMPVTPLVDEPAQSIQRQLAINVTGVIYGTQLAIERMAPRGTGHVVNIASAAGRMGFGGVSTYSATKFAVAGFTEAVALEAASSGIVFTTVYPGMVTTELSAGIPDHWLMRSCSPEVVAAAVMDAVRRGRRSVYVPRRLGPVAAVYGALPVRARAAVMGLLGADHRMLDGDADIRQTYESRVGKAHQT